MPINKKSHLSTELYELLQQFHYEITARNADGEATTEPEDMMVFAFPFKDRHGHEKNTVEVDLLDPRCMMVTLVPGAKGEHTCELDELTEKLKDWATSHDLQFNLEQLGTKRMKRNDLAVMESQFTPLSGTVKTSTQYLPNAKLLIHHTDIINDDVRGARTRRIHRIYVINNKGERFLLPTVSLRGARAHARHVDQGGNPYDSAGQAISNCSDEATQLGKFIRRTRNRDYGQEQPQQIIAAAQSRLAEVRQLLQRLSSERGYKKYLDQLPADAELEYDDSLKDQFTQNRYDEQLDNCLPFAWRAYQMSQLKEMQQFESWMDKTVDEAFNPQQVQKALGSTGVSVDNEGVKVNSKDPNAMKTLQDAAKDGKLKDQEVPVTFTEEMTTETIGGDEADDFISDVRHPHAVTEDAITDKFKKFSDDQLIKMYQRMADEQLSGSAAFLFKSMHKELQKRGINVNDLHKPALESLRKLSGICPVKEEGELEEAGMKNLGIRSHLNFIDDLIAHDDEPDTYAAPRFDPLIRIKVGDVFRGESPGGGEQQRHVVAVNDDFVTYVIPQHGGVQKTQRLETFKNWAKTAEVVR